ncbi:murein hydrolase activator EnvC family protein [Solitalea canadensis]|uniref:Membrane-bound metallopeptidase n=1 Tax=Solitalea canadensis (strain ATCC 29591 / DSM 3403 / JCM 21819 / LMG 8368 / NBRC 15130 / NCIMB 12057 / USAM 9D) TaxID=929556 RepID=H8KWY2_SOLCM|nr:M23 family metallopeptidase [Solitalea canadensis]AFD08311.1 membrane-bound metallopeptidase [Solitalea canadensis DSM 3403]
MVSKKKDFLTQLKTKYKLVVLKDDTFEEKISFTLNLMNVFVAAGMGAIILIILTTFLIVFTPLKEYIPGYADVSLKINVAEAAMKADSLEMMFKANQTYLNNIKSIIDGKAGVTIADSVPQVAVKDVEVDKKHPKVVEDFREYIESEEKISLKDDVTLKKKSSIKDLDFISPVKGTVVARYDTKNNRLYQIIGTVAQSPVKATLDGIVLYAGLTVDAGYMVVLQHTANIITVYKNCSILYKKTGNYVKADEVIATAGDKGKEFSGPQLAFELWNNGFSVDPNEYMKF